VVTTPLPNELISIFASPAPSALFFFFFFFFFPDAIVLLHLLRRAHLHFGLKQKKKHKIGLLITLAASVEVGVFGSWFIPTLPHPKWVAPRLPRARRHSRQTADRN
jgi:hypothetical protein